MFILLGITSCSWYEEDDDILYDRTVLIYMAADNNLSYSHSYPNTTDSLTGRYNPNTYTKFSQEDIDEIVAAVDDIPHNSRLVIYIDDTELPRIITAEKQEGRRASIKILHEYTEEHDSGNAETLRLAMKWTSDHFPSKGYGLVLWSHGDAWIPAKAPTTQRIVCQDTEARSWMEIADITNALKDFPCLDFILFDACFMQSIEVAYELRHDTHYVIGSPAEIPAPGAPYKRIMKGMFAPTNYAQTIAQEYYQEYSEGRILIKGQEKQSYGVCLSVIDCSQLDLLAETTQEVLSKYISMHSSIDLDGVQRYYLRDSDTRPEYYDINGYMKRLLTNIEDYTLWASILDRTAPYRPTTTHWYSDYTGQEQVDTLNYSGISCYVPQNTSSRVRLNTAFQSTAWYHATGWELWYRSTKE